MSNTFNDVLLTLGQWMILINIIFLMCFTAYKVALYSAIADLTYHHSEVLEAFKAGVKGIWSFKIILFFFILFEVLVSFFIPFSNTDIKNAYTLVNYLVPGFIMILIISYYNYAEDTEKLTETTLSNGNKISMNAQQPH